MDNFIFTARHEKFLPMRVTWHRMSDFRRARVGCVAVINGRVVATGFSQHRTHPMQQYYNRYRDFDGQANVAHKLHGEAAMLFTHTEPGDWSKADVCCVSALPVSGRTVLQSHVLRVKWRFAPLASARYSIQRTRGSNY